MSGPVGSALVWVLAVLLAAATAALAVPRPPAARSRARLLVAPRPEVQPSRRGWAGRLAAVLVALGLVTLAAVVGGTRGAVVGGAVMISATTVLRVATLHARDRRARRAQTDVARACGVLASYVRVGQVATDALVLVARECPVLAEAAAVQQIGGNVPDALRSRSGQPGHAGLADLARAWQVSSSTGAPVAPALEEVASGLASDESLRSVVSAELSA